MPSLQHVLLFFKAVEENEKGREQNIFFVILQIMVG